MTFTYKLEFFMYVVFTTNSIKMSRRLTILEHFSILDVHYNSNFLGVDVFLHQIFSKNVKMFLFLPLGRNEVRRSFSNDTTAGRLFFGQKQQWQPSFYYKIVVPQNYCSFRHLFMLWFCFGNKFDFTERVMTDFDQNHCDTQGYISTSSYSARL